MLGGVFNCTLPTLYPVESLGWSCDIAADTNKKTIVEMMIFKLLNILSE
jgi:hypothetical protein